MWTALISPLASLAGTFLEGQVSKSKAKAELVQTEAAAKAEIMKMQRCMTASGNSSWLSPRSMAGKMRW